MTGSEDDAKAQDIYLSETWISRVMCCSQKFITTLVVGREVQCEHGDAESLLFLNRCGMVP